MEIVVVRNTSGSKTPIPVLEVPTVIKECIQSFADKGRKKLAKVIKYLSFQILVRQAMQAMTFLKTKVKCQCE
jgi:hypothetical protein